MNNEELVEVARRGDKDAFSELMRRNYSASLRLATSILGQRELAEDEVQNAYWNAYTHMAQFHAEARFSTWITRIVVNQCLMRLRQIRRVNMVFLDDVPTGSEQHAFELPDGMPTPESTAEANEIAAIVGTEIRRIPPLLRNAFVLRDVEDLPMPEVARRLGISVAAAKSRLLRARAELRARLMRALKPGAWKSGTLKSFGAIV